MSNENKKGTSIETDIERTNNDNDIEPTSSDNNKKSKIRKLLRNKNEDRPILTPDEQRLKFRLKWLVIFLFTVLIILVIVLVYAARTDNFATPAIIVITCTLSSALTTVLGSIIGTTIQ